MSEREFDDAVAATHGWITSAVPKRWDTRG
jgi:hypothetical protein